MPRFPLDDAYERLKAIIDELRHLTQRVNEAMERSEDVFATQLERTMRGES